MCVCVCHPKITIGMDTDASLEKPSSLTQSQPACAGDYPAWTHFHAITPVTSLALDTLPSATPGAEKALSMGAGASAGSSSTEVGEQQTYKHHRLPFLQPDKIKDGKGRRPDHPKYDPRTLLVDSKWVTGEPPAQQLWWQIREKNNDLVFLFKIGKFYEM